nr:hypothetical protein [Tanacetum cinerariifolium]
MEKFKKAIFKKGKKINNRMAEMVRLLKELTTSRTSEKVLVGEEASSPITKCVNAISLFKIAPIELVERKKEMEDKTDDESVRSMKEELTRCETKAEVLVEMLRSHPIGYYLKYVINKKIIEGIAEDVLIDIVGYVYPVDFVILDIDEDKNKSFILRTPFLTTTKAEIRFDKGTITLKSGKNKIIFFKISGSPCKN